MLGVVIGGIAAWLAQGKHRRERRRYRREANTLRTETDRLKSGKALHERADSTVPFGSSLGSSCASSRPPKSIGR